MTLILAAATGAHAVVVADRRTTTGDGRVRSEETGKLAVAVMDDARVAVTYAGLAEYGQFRTRFWLPHALGEIGKSEHRLGAIVDALQGAAEEAIAGLRGLSALDARLTILVAGYQYDASGSATPAFARISNFEREVFETRDPVTGQVKGGVRPVTREFSVVTDRSPKGFTVGAGFSAGVTWKQMEDLQERMMNGAGPRALRARMVHLVRQVGADKASQGLIGGQCSSVVIPADPQIAVDMDYHTLVGTSTVHLPAWYDLRRPGRGGGVMLVDPVIRYGEPGSPPVLVGPVAGKRKCPCGSGLQYRRCHGAKGGGKERLTLGW